MAIFFRFIILYSPERKNIHLFFRIAAQFDQRQGIDPVAVDSRSPVKMRVCNASRCTHKADDFALANNISFVCRYFVKMKIHADDAPAMVYINRFAAEKMIGRWKNPAVIDGGNRIAFWTTPRFLPEI